MSCSSRLRAVIVGLFGAAIVGLGLDARARAQTVEVAPPDRPVSEAPPSPPPEAAPSPRLYSPPEVAPPPPPEASPGAPPAPRPPSAPPDAVPTASPEAPPASTGPAAFGAAWHYAISIERAFGVDHISQTESYDGQEFSKTTATNFSLFGVPTAGALSAFSFPRGAFDLFVAPDFSVGLGLGFIHGSTSLTEMGGLSDNQTTTGILAVPRVGYAWHLTPDITLWTRAGISAVYLKTSTGNAYGSQDTTEHFVAVTAELPLVFALAPRVAFTAGPTLDITFVGKKSYPYVGDFNAPDRDEHITELGVQAGLLIHL